MSEKKDQKKENSVVKKIEELATSKLDETFKMPECEAMDDDEVQEKAKALFPADKFIL